MTLFEITVSLGLVAFASVTVLAVLPQAVRTQERIKAGTLAASRVLEMAHVFTATPFSNTGIDDQIPLRHATQIRQPWDSVAWRLGQRFDLEHKLGSMTGGLCPLPTDIARRLDADDDEIQRILDDGGYVYYANPMSPSQIPLNRRDPDSYTSTLEMPTEARRLVFGFVGYAQQDAISRFPWRAGLQHFPYPSPPHAPGDVASSGGMSDAARVIQSTLDDGDLAGYAAAFIGAASGHSNAKRFPSKALPGFGTARPPQLPVEVQRYYLVARWYARKRLDPLKLAEPALYADLLRGVEIDRDACARILAAIRPSDAVNAMRYLAHAAMALTRVHSKAELDTGVAIGPHDFLPKLSETYEDASLAGVEDLGTGFDLPRTVITTPRIVAMHQNSMRLAMLYAASFPNDWVAPRPLNRAIMMDVPLLQWDVLSTPLTGRLFPLTVDDQRQWRPLGSTDMRSADLGYGGAGLWLAHQHNGWSRGNNNGNLGFYIGQDFGAVLNSHDIWSPDPDHFNLAKPFHPRERCRQVVVWAVDWQAYEDFETAPSAAVDSSRMPLSIPIRREGDRYDPAMTSLQQRMTSPSWQDWTHPTFRNPEKMLLFVDNVSGSSSGQPVRVFGSTRRWNSSGGDPIMFPDQPIGRWTSTRADSGKIFLGLYGADRNGNRLLDRGPVPRGQRMRATTIGRFNLYDPRVPLCFN